MMTPLPAAYGWIDEIAMPPRLLSAMRSLYGVHEGQGPALDNPAILGWAETLGLGKLFVHDATPWCGLAMAWACHLADKPFPAAPLWALNWAKWGEEGGQPDLGDVLVFVRPGGGHVGLYIGEDTVAYHVLGGNESDAVSITRIDKHRLYAVRELFAIGKPSTAIPRLLSAEGALSQNEV